MTIITEIAEELEDHLDLTATRMELIEALPHIKIGSLGSALTRGVQSEILERLERGVYKLNKIYYKIEVTKTSHYENKEKGNLDVDATLTGWMKNDRIDLIERKIDDDVKEKTNFELVQEIIDMFEDEFDQTDGTDVIKITKRGWEILDNDHNFIKSRYETHWEYEINVTAQDSRDYTFTGFRIIDEKEFD